jgi:tRNA pseudouridine13 synthase
MTAPSPLGALAPGEASFAVEEIPAYEPGGRGEHLYVHVRKRGWTTDQAASALARALGRPLSSVGFAGRKDRHAVTSQWFSVQGADPERLAALRDAGDRMEILEVARHANKLRLGHLRGNRFRLQLQGLDGEDERAELERRGSELAQGGLVNRFGAQRFGTAGSTLAIARAWGAGDLAGALRFLVDPFGRWELGAELPRGARSGPQGRALGALRSAPGDPARALRAAGRSFRLLVASAAQSAIFNAVLDARERELGLYALRVGDLAQGSGGAPFRCRPERLAELLQEAAPGRLQIQATGPLPGRSSFVPDPPIAAQEMEWASELRIDWSWFERGAALDSAGARRALVVPFLELPSVVCTPSGVELCFALRKGSYATQVLEQLGVAGRAAASTEDTRDGEDGAVATTELA